jgi:hypothetical protein
MKQTDKPRYSQRLYHFCQKNCQLHMSHLKVTTIFQMQRTSTPIVLACKMFTAQKVDSKGYKLSLQLLEPFYIDK